MKAIYCVCSLVLLAVPAATDPVVHVLPRSHDDLEVRAQVECLHPDGCNVSHLCLTPAEWASDEPADFLFISSATHGDLTWTPWTADSALACAVRVEGVASVLGEKGHRDAYGAQFARESVPLGRLRSAVGELDDPDVPLASGMDDCRPATWTGECADAVHLPEANCPNGEPAWHVYIEDRFDGDLDPYDHTMVPRSEIPEGELSVFMAQARAPSDWNRTYHWRIAHGRWNDYTWSNQRRTARSSTARPTWPRTPWRPSRSPSRRRATARRPP